MRQHYVNGLKPLFKIITNGKLNIQRIQPIESSVVDGSTHSSEVGTKPKTQQLRSKGMGLPGP